MTHFKDLSTLLADVLKMAGSDIEYDLMLLPSITPKINGVMSDEFKTADLLEEARVRGLCRDSVFLYALKGARVWLNMFISSMLLSEKPVFSKLLHFRERGRDFWHY